LDGSGSASKFQSAPGGEAGGNVVGRPVPTADGGFQSAPGGEAGGNHDREARGLDIGLVSIRPRR